MREGLALLDEELGRLPEQYRAVIIVCCLEGRSRDEAATQLGWSDGQVKGRLERAREMLRTRLLRRGLELGGVLLAATVASPAPALPPPQLLATFPVAVSLTNGAIHAMMIQKLKAVAVVMLLAGTAGAVTYYSGPGAMAHSSGPSGGPEASGKEPPKAVAEEPAVKNRWEKRLQDKELTAKQRAAYEQLAKLHTVNLQLLDGWAIQIPSLGPESKIPTDVLYRMGMDILPILAEALDDETPTETVTDFRGRMKKTWQVNEFAALLIGRIADRDFVVGEKDKEITIREIAKRPKAAASFRTQVVEWHEEYAAKTPLERKIADVNDLWFRNRFDAVIWLGEKRAKEGRARIAARVEKFYADPNRPYDSLTRAEMAHCALALGQIGDEQSLPQVQRVCEDMSYWIETYGLAGSAMPEDLFRAYRGLALLGKKDETLKELERLDKNFGAKLDESDKKEFAERMKVAKKW
jgi:hypothetical protein